MESCCVSEWITVVVVSEWISRCARVDYGKRKFTLDSWPKLIGGGLVLTKEYV